MVTKNDDNEILDICNNGNKFVITSIFVEITIKIMKMESSIMIR